MVPQALVTVPSGETVCVEIPSQACANDVLSLLVRLPISSRGLLVSRQNDVVHDYLQHFPGCMAGRLAWNLTPVGPIVELTNSHVQHKHGQNLYLHDGARILSSDAVVRAGAHLALCGRLCGGKGGYGNMLRAMGRKHGLGDNTGDCRSLDGRRLRDVEAAQQAADWVASQQERDEAKAQEKKEREQEKAQLREAEQKEIQTQAVRAIQLDAGQVDSSVKVGLKRAADAHASSGAAPSAVRSNPLPTKRAKLLGLSDDDEGSSSDDSSGSADEGSKCYLERGKTETAAGSSQELTSRAGTVQAR